MGPIWAAHMGPISVPYGALYGQPIIGCINDIPLIKGARVPYGFFKQDPCGVSPIQKLTAVFYHLDRI